MRSRASGQCASSNFHSDVDGVSPDYSNENDVAFDKGIRLRDHNDFIDLTSGITQADAVCDIRNDGSFTNAKGNQVSMKVEGGEDIEKG